MKPVDKRTPALLTMSLALLKMVDNMIFPHKKIKIKSPTFCQTELSL